MNYAEIQTNVKRVLNEIPKGVILEAAVKSRSESEIRAAVDAGIKVFGDNYVVESQKNRDLYRNEDIKCHLIGHLQRNKVKKAVALFDMVETLDSVRLARAINKKSCEIGKVMPVLIEVNSGLEKQKYGILPNDVKFFINKIKNLKNLKVQGLMTMGPFTGNPENARKYFTDTKKIFQSLKVNCPENVEMKYLSMGMSNSYKVAIEEGANIIRVGSALFGPRQSV